MARGITEQQVHDAADALVVAGERPTVERIRQHLGTGSPNTVTRLLESWWQALGPRLSEQAQKIALPDAPAPVAVLASQLWEQALASAREEAAADLAQDRHTLAGERDTANAAIADARQAEETACASAAEATAALSNAQERLADRQVLIEQQGQQIEDLVRQREAAVRRGEQAEAEAAALRCRLEQMETDAQAARESEAAHLRSVEDRAHAEVDRARQETQELRRLLSATEEAHAAQVRQLQTDLDQLRSATVKLDRELAAAHATRTGLEAQAADLRHSLQEALKARPAGTKAAKRPRRSRTKTKADAARDLRDT